MTNVIYKNCNTKYQQDLDKLSAYTAQVCHYPVQLTL